MATVDIRDNVTAALQGMKAGLQPGNLNERIGRSEVDFFRKWFVARGPNTRGFPSTGFWAQAARATNYSLLPDGVLISVNKIGVRQQFQGGDIEPTGGKKYLTIPASPEAYGKRAGQFGDTLKVAMFGPEGGEKRLALVQAIAQQFSLGKQRKDGSRKVKPGKVTGGVMYWLVKHVHQEGDPTVLPPDAEITGVAMSAVMEALDQAAQ